MTMIINPYRFGSAVSLYTAMNPADKAPNINLASGDLVVTSTVVGPGIVRSVANITGKKYFEAVFVAAEGGTATIAAGVAMSTHTITAPLGYSVPEGWGFWGTGTGARHNGTTAISTGSSPGDVYGFAVDQPGGKLWIRKNGTWLQGDPATDTLPIWTDLSGTLYAAACPWTPDAIIHMRFDPGTFANAAPSGFSPILA